MEEREVAIEAALPSELSRFLESMGSVPQADA
jgi:hypothetical protein